AAFALVISPNAWWLVTHDFQPFQYVNARADAATRWYQYLVYPLQWIATQALSLVPAIGLLALLPRGSAATPADAQAAFNRRYVTALALGPFLVTTAIAALLGRQPVAMWGYPLWSFAPLAAMMWRPPGADALRLRRSAAG